ncbi:predicted phosphohydrolase [Hahella chejuensis KCTC 2396]|uniref:Predicted phosphohydrolase n=1 Tax=Hahella chejuensis (strain KCTC 2396) TaxID=349521 RepID=Q2SE35_HAHCH|nr:metallophosphoesterase [Hahella chejuensis]ABC31089.1 predicted phosphohydrolase [Hahella chejuensis KCTC 2396]
MQIIQLSDPHFGTEDWTVQEALVRTLNDMRPELLLFSGDITQRATRLQFAAARAFLERIEADNVLAVPGNHDIPLFNLWSRLTAPYKKYCEIFGTDLEPEFENNLALIVGVNTTHKYRHVDGEISPQRADAVARRLASAPDKLRVVVAHHPCQVVLPSDQKNLLIGREYALKAWIEAGVDLVLGGHIHYPFILPLRESFPEAPSGVFVMQAGTATSPRVRSGKPNSFNRILVRRDRRMTLLERWDYDSATGRFRVALRFSPWGDESSRQVQATFC